MNQPTQQASNPDYGWQEAPPHSCAYLAPVVVQVLRDLGARRVVDVGAGNGVLCGDLAAAGFEVTGVEPDEQGVEVARARLPQITFHHAGVHDDPAPVLATGGPFDVAVSTEVIEHLYAPHLLPRFAQPLVRPGGHLVITTPYHGYWKNLALSVLDKWDHHHTALWHGGHIKFFSRRTLSQLLEENGWRVRRFQGIGRLPGLWKSMLLVAERA